MLAERHKLADTVNYNKTSKTRVPVSRAWRSEKDQKYHYYLILLDALIEHKLASHNSGAGMYRYFMLKAGVAAYLSANFRAGGTVGVFDTLPADPFISLFRRAPYAILDEVGVMPTDWNNWEWFRFIVETHPNPYGNEGLVPFPGVYPHCTSSQKQSFTLLHKIIEEWLGRDTYERVINLNIDCIKWTDLYATSSLGFEKASDPEEVPGLEEISDPKESFTWGGVTFKEAGTYSLNKPSDTKKGPFGNNQRRGYSSSSLHSDPFSDSISNLDPIQVPSISGIIEKTSMELGFMPRDWPRLVGSSESFELIDGVKRNSSEDGFSPSSG